MTNRVLVGNRLVARIGHPLHTFISKALCIACFSLMLGSADDDNKVIVGLGKAVNVSQKCRTPDYGASPKTAFGYLG
jgi:hypothetical protein